MPLPARWTSSAARSGVSVFFRPLYPSFSEALNQGAEVIKVARETVHAMDDHGVAVANKAEQLGQLRPRGVPTGRLVCENPVQHLALELAQFILVHGAHP
jgi:hypothetical protein